jgi:hypothetical protein
MNGITPAMEEQRTALLGLGLMIATIVACFVMSMFLPDDRPPRGAERMSPLDNYARWYRETATCAQLPELNYTKIEWYVVPDVISFRTSIGQKVGLWEQEPDEYSRITIAGAYVNNEMVVKHEMLHNLIRIAGHPPLYFEDRCQLTWDTWQTDRHPS